MKNKKIFLPIALGLVLILVFIGSIFLNKEIRNNIDGAKLITEHINVIDENLVQVISDGYAGKNTIKITYDISGEDVKVVEIENMESYIHNHYYDSANGDPFEKFEESVNSGNSFDEVNISGATMTTNYIKENYKLLQEYLCFVGGK